MNASPSIVNGLLDERAAAVYLNVSIAALRAWRTRGGGPRFAKLGVLVRYRAADLETWIESSLAQNTSQSAGR